MKNIRRVLRASGCLSVALALPAHAQEREELPPLEAGPAGEEAELGEQSEPAKEEAELGEQSEPAKKEVGQVEQGNRPASTQQGSGLSTIESSDDSLTSNPEVERAGLPSPAQGDPDAVFRAYRVYVREERRRRMMGGLGGVVLGGATMGIGVLVANETDTDAKPWLIAGGVAVGVSALSFLLPSPAEAIARKHQVDRESHDELEAKALEAAWKSHAEALRRGRTVSAVVNFALGAGTLGTGIAFATGAGSFERSDRITWSSVLIGTGAGLLVSGVSNLVIQSPAERSYALFRASQPGPDRERSVALVPLGLGLSAQGIF